MKWIHDKLRFRLTMCLAAIVMVTSLMMFGVSETQASTVLNNPVTADRGDGSKATVWDCVYFGHYPQSRDGQGGFVWEPIKWRVLSVEGTEALLLADKNLDVLPYHEEKMPVSWEQSTLRSWLNGYDGHHNGCGKDFTQDNFLDIAFSPDEQAAILTVERRNDDNAVYGTDGGNITGDKAYLLSIDEVTNGAYGFHEDRTKYDDTREGKNTEYVSSIGNMSQAGFSDFWWICTPGVSPYYAAIVDEAGYVDPLGSIANGGNVAVRPALQLDLSSDVWSHAGTVSSDGKEAAYIGENPVKLSQTTYLYNGNYCEPDVTISGLQQGVDYTVAYQNHKEPGTAAVIITGTGNYVGTVTINFTIEKTSEPDSRPITGNERKISKATLGKTAYVYNGKARKPAVTVRNSSGMKLTKGTHYTVAYKNNTKVGKATVTIKGIGSYKGTITKTFKINPVTTNINSVRALKKGFTVKWTKKTKQVDGYQLCYGTSANKNKGKKVLVKKNKTTSKKITRLARGKKYNVWVRTYKTVKGKKYYSAWSEVKRVKTK